VKIARSQRIMKSGQQHIAKLILDELQPISTITTDA
jgi:hypothetical protein